MIPAMIPAAVLPLLAPASVVLGILAAGLYLGVFLPRLGGSRPAWKVLGNLEDFRTRCDRDGQGLGLWGAFVLILATSLCLGLGALVLQVRAVTGG